MKTFSLRATTLVVSAALACLCQQADAAATTTPIKHLIVVVGENVTFDTIYGTYPPPHGQSIDNLVSKGIVKPDGTPSPSYHKAVQRTATNDGGHYTPVGDDDDRRYRSGGSPAVGDLTTLFDFPGKKRDR